MGKVKGEDVILYITSAEDKEEYVIACARSITFDISQDIIETSITGAGRFRSYLPGAITWSGSVEGLVFIQKDPAAPGDNWDMGRLYSYIINKQIFYLRWFETDIENLHYLEKTGECYIESINETASFDNMTTFSITFRGTGAITIVQDEI